MPQMVNNLLVMWETQVQSMGWEHLLEKRMASHSSILETLSFFFFLIYVCIYLWYRFSDSYFIR